MDKKSEVRTIKAILFDMDGVLIDAKEWHYEAQSLGAVWTGDIKG